MVMAKLAAFLNRLSPRERNLAITVSLLVPLFLLMLLARGALANVRALNARIDALQRQIVDYHFQIARKQQVEAEYEKVATQHSSEWDQQTISDRMRAEIRRLARTFPPPLDENGVPVTTENEHGNLIELPGLDEGTLTQGDGFREHTLRLSIPLDDLSDIINFLERIQSSPQSLRIDDLELYRPPMTTLASANLTITRTIVDRNTSGNGVEAEPVSDTGTWLADGCTLEGDDPENLSAVANQDRARVYRLVSLPAGGIYEMQLDVTTEAASWMAVADETGVKTLEGALSFIDNGQKQRYRAQFKVPGKHGATTRLRLPMITVARRDGKVQLDNFKLLRIAE